MKKLLICSLIIFIIWAAIDFVVHGIYLKEYYLQTADIWRSEGDAKIVINALVILIGAIIFSLIYIALVGPKSFFKALLYGSLVGVSVGVTIAYGMYAFLPIPYHMAVTWFVTYAAEGFIAGTILGFMAKP